MTRPRGRECRPRGRRRRRPARWPLAAAGFRGDRARPPRAGRRGSTFSSAAPAPGCSLIGYPEHSFSSQLTTRRRYRSKRFRVGDPPPVAGSAAPGLAQLTRGWARCSFDRRPNEQGGLDVRCAPREARASDRNTARDRRRATCGAATQIGETFTPAPDSCLGPITFLQSLSPQASYTVLSPGVITAWSHEASVPTTPIKFKVGNRGPGDSFQDRRGKRAEDACRRARSTRTCDVRITVAGRARRSGSMWSGQGGRNARAAAPAMPGTTFTRRDGRSGPGAAPSTRTTGWTIAARPRRDLSSPTADGDGYGDETQDECPTDGAGRCRRAARHRPARDQITKGAPNKLDKPKVKFKFTADEPDVTLSASSTRSPTSPARRRRRSSASTTASTSSR